MYNIEDIPLDLLKDNPYDTRKKVGDIESLAYSIKKRGLKTPITVVKSEKDFIIVHGHRRSHAFRFLKRKTIPAIIQKESTPSDLMVDLAIENFQRKDLTPPEKASTIEKLFYEIPSVKTVENVLALINQIRMIRDGKEEVGGGFSIDDIHKGEDFLDLIGLSPNTATMYVRLLFLPEDVQQNIVAANNGNSIPEGKMGIRTGYELTRIKDPDIQKELSDKIIKDNLKYVQIKHIVDNIIENDNKVARKSKSGSPERRIEDDAGLTKLTADLFSLSSSIEHFRAKLPLACGRLEKAELTASLEKTKKACMDMVKNVNKFLHEDMKAEELLEYVNSDLDVVVNDDFRFTIPSRMVEHLGINKGDVLLLKIEGIKKAEGKKVMELVNVQ